MNNINITNIFSNNTLLNNSNKNICINDFSVNTLIESNTFNTIITDDYIIDKIKINKKNEIIKTNDFYNSKYKECLVKINNAIELNLIEIIYSVENSYFGYQTYNSDECIKHIEKKLKEKNFLTKKITNKDIIISWGNIN
jgi:hypothetical protein